MDLRANIKRAFIAGLLLLSFGCASASTPGFTIVGDKQYRYIVGRDGSAAGPTICMMNLVQTNLDGTGSKVVYSAAAHTGGAFDSVFSSGKLISIGTMATTIGGVP